MYKDHNFIRTQNHKQLRYNNNNYPPLFSKHFRQCFFLARIDFLIIWEWSVSSAALWTIQSRKSRRSLLRVYHKLYSWDGPQKVITGCQVRTARWWINCTPKSNDSVSKDLFLTYLLVSTHTDRRVTVNSNYVAEGKYILLVLYRIVLSNSHERQNAVSISVCRRLTSISSAKNRYRAVGVNSHSTKTLRCSCVCSTAAGRPQQCFFFKFHSQLR